MTTETAKIDKQPYLSEFLKLRCVGDVLNTVNPIGKKPKKEITESMGIFKRLKNIVLKKPDYYYTIYDLCAGNALTSVLAVFRLPVYAMAIDKLQRKRNWHLAKRFIYLNKDIYDMEPNKSFLKNSIIISVHPCKQLAKKAIELYNECDEVKHLILMPCCSGAIVNEYAFLKQRIGKDVTWAFQLAQQCKGRVNMVEDKKVLSPRNCIITASKEN